MKTKQKNSLFIVIFLVVFVLIFVFVIYPLFKDISGMAKELSRQEGRLITLRLKIDSLEEFRTINKELKGNLDKIDKLLIDSEVPVNFISYLETTAQETGLDFEISSANSQTSKKDPWPYVVFQATANGSFSDLLKYLEKIENSHYLIEIRNINVREAGNGNIKATFSIKVFAK